MKKYKYFIGIDPGTKTGLAAKSGGKLILIESYKILDAMDRVIELHQGIERGDLLVVIEDARQRKWFGDDPQEAEAKAQGAGSVKRDTKIWVEFCERENIDYELVHPIKNATKLKEDTFKAITGWTGVTNEHKRDAAMLIFGR